MSLFTKRLILTSALLISEKFAFNANEKDIDKILKLHKPHIKVRKINS